MLFDFVLNPQIVILGVLAIMFVLFIINKIRFDLVALGGLVVLALLGVIGVDELALGFGDPVIITVVGVFVFGAGLVRSGLVDAVSRKIIGLSNNPIIELFVLLIFTAALSSFVINVAAIALMIPIAIRVAHTHKKPLALYLMPVAFASLLGGMATSIGTPVNIIVSAARDEAAGAPFGLFDFAPVGYALSALGIIFLGLIGWRMIPKRKERTLSDELFDIKDYLTEIQVPYNSKWVNKEVRDLQKITEHNLSVIGIVRADADSQKKESTYQRISQPTRYERLLPGDLILVRADSETLETLLDSTDLKLIGSKAISQEDLGTDAIETMEAVVEENSPIVGQSMRTLGLKTYGTNLLALARENKRIYSRLANVVFQPGDVLLLRGKTETLFDTISRFGALPLRKRDLRLGTPRRIMLALSIFLGAILLSVLDVFPLTIIFLLAAGAMIISRLLPVTEVYEAINWPSVVLLGSMLTIGRAFEANGAAESVVSFFFSLTELGPEIAVASIFILSILLANAIDGTAVAIIMAPVAVILAQEFGASVDPFLMATAVGCSTVFLTPIGAQSSGLVMSPAGYHFSDYTKVGGLLTVLIFTLGLPLILTIWPL